MTVINTNVNSLVARNAITGNARDLSTAMERLSTGNRINSAKDDAAGLAISTRMDSQARGLSVAIRNANDGISLMQTTEGALDTVTDILQRMRELAVQSVNGTNNASDRSALNDEVQELKTEIERIATTTEFNSQKLLDGSFSDKKIQIGDKEGQTLNIDIGSARLQDLGLGGSTGGTSDALVGARWAVAAVDAGDILINDQELAAIASTDDLEDIIDNINENVDNVLASGFNTVVAKTIGDGVTTDGQLDIAVTSLGATAATTFSISASESLEELVSNINYETGGLVSASINDDGKLVLSNDTGASITVTDASATALAYDGGSGFRTTAQTFTGFLKLESTNGSPVRIDKSDEGTTADLQSLGFRATTSDDGFANDAYTVTGIALTAVGAATAWSAQEISINGVAIYDSEITTTSFTGKLAAINNFSAETGVTGSAYLDFTANYTATAGAFVMNGTSVTLTVGDTAAAAAVKLNAQTGTTGVTFESVNNGSQLRVTGSNVTSLTTSGTAGSASGFSTATHLAGIRLDSVNNTPISIELGDTVVQANHGLLEANVGAADFEVNAATLGVASGNSLSGLDVSSVSSATKAIASMDAAIETVSSMRSQLGATQNRLTRTVDNLSNVMANTQASRSRIQDTDYAAESTALAKAQIIQQAATAMLAQANQQPQSVLSLLQ